MHACIILGLIDFIAHLALTKYFLLDSSKTLIILSIRNIFDHCSCYFDSLYCLESIDLKFIVPTIGIRAGDCVTHTQILCRDLLGF